MLELLVIPIVVWMLVITWGVGCCWKRSRDARGLPEDDREILIKLAGAIKKLRGRR